MSRIYQCGDIEFKGALLGSSTTGDSDKTRWTDVHVYRTDGGRFIGHVIGRSIVPNETDLHTVHHSADPDEIIQKMHHKGRLPLPSYQALNSAAVNCEDLDDALDRFEQPTFIN